MTRNPTRRKFLGRTAAAAAATVHTLLARGGTTIVIQFPADSKWVSNGNGSIPNWGLTVQGAENFIAAHT
jgi:hypothetical protein